MRNLALVDHPVLRRSLTVLRRRDTQPQVFRAELRRCAVLLATEALRSVRTARVRVDTPLEAAEGIVFDEEVVLVPVLRAGLTLVDAFLELVPDARVGHVGLYRDEKSLRPVGYYKKLPDDLEEALVLVLDPMLATGGSAVATLDAVLQKGARRVQLVCLIAAPEGVALVEEKHPDVRIVAGSLDRGLDQNAFIRPGLGDAGDRAFGTD